MALAVDVSGTYSGQNVSVVLSSDGGMVRGEVAVNGRTLPLVGHESNGSIQGVWRTPDGQDVPFAATAGPDGIQLQTNGMTYSLARGQGNTGGSINPQAGGQMAAAEQVDPQPVTNAGGEAVQLELETRQGRVMQCAIPAGWTFSESTNGVDVSTPNGRLQMSHTYLRTMGRSNPDLFLQTTLRQMAQWGVANVQITSCSELSPQSKLYELQYTVRGQPVRAKFQVTIRPGPEGFTAEVVRVQTAPELFDRFLPLLITMAKSVRVLDGNAFCANAQMNGEIVKQNNIRTQSIHDVAAIRSAGVAHQNQVRDEINQSSDDYIRSQSRFDDKGGNQYTAPLAAERMFKHSDGTVTYSTNFSDPVPPGAVELTPHRLAGR
jgi:hypothetical protein